MSNVIMSNNVAWATLETSRNINSAENPKGKYGWTLIPNIHDEIRTLKMKTKVDVYS